MELQREVNVRDKTITLKLRESINFDFNLKRIALEGNAYACYEIGSNEYCGYVTGKPRYEEAYKYFKILQ